jgi:ComEC/Rec2-related protein
MVILFCISLILGAVGYYVFDWSLFEISFLGALWGALFILFFRSKKSVVLGVALALSVTIGGLRFWVIEPPMLSLGNQAFVGIVERVDKRLTKTLFVVRPEESDVRIQVTTYDDTELLPGDVVSLRGTVVLPEDFTTETGRVFDYDGYLESRGVDAVMYRAQVTAVGKRDMRTPLFFSRIATVIRHGIGEQFARYIIFPIDGIVAGMLVGFQGALPEYLSDIFRRTGTLHTLVLSGYNITVLAGFIGFIFRRVPFKIRTLSIFTGIASLVLISGAGVAAVRAGIMGSIALLAGATLNTYNVFRALLLSFLFFFFMNPVTIFVDPGFHLSFLATFFIIALLPILKEKTPWIPEWKWGIKETLLLAVGLPLFMLPYFMYFSGLFPFMSPLANIVMVPLIPLLMIGGVVTLIVSPIPFLAGVAGALTSFVGTIAVHILSFFSVFPQWNTPLLSGWGVVLFYTVFLVLIFRKEIQQQIIEYKNIFSQHKKIA